MSNMLTGPRPNGYATRGNRLAMRYAGPAAGVAAAIGMPTAIVTADVVLTVNAGSSSLRLDAFVMDAAGPRRIASAHDAHGGAIPEDAIAAFVRTLAPHRVAAVCHRVVHGGAQFRGPTPIDDAVLAEIARYLPLAPIHNRLALQGIAAVRTALGGECRQVAAFDTAFFADLPAVAATYALPKELAAKHELRRFGFHGLAHQSLWSQWQATRPGHGGRIITLQLGAGCSAAAIEDGAPLDTSMGMTPLDGLVMATRPGDLDPGVVLYLQDELGMDSGRVNAILTHESGLLGVSGMTGDMRALLDSDDPSARLAVDLFCYRVRKYIGAYLAVLGGADAIVFGGGIGEHAPEIRRRILAGMEWCGITLDHDRNISVVGVQARINATGNGPEVWVMPVDEAAEMAAAAMRLLEPASQHA